MVQRALNRWATPAVAIPVSSHYDQTTRDRMMTFQAARGVKPADGSMEQATLDRLWPFFDQYGRWRYRLYHAPRIPALGPVWRGGVSVLAHDLTHATDGIPLYPAFDDAFRQGEVVIAPESLRVCKHPTSSNPGHAIYACGGSKIGYWFGHLDRAHPLGTTFRKGKEIGRVAANSIGGGPHVHVGINVEALLGPGTELEHHTNYTHGAPTVGEQLRRSLR